jgi:hypothetical protein
LDLDRVRDPRAREPLEDLVDREEAGRLEDATGEPIPGVVVGLRDPWGPEEVHFDPARGDVCGGCGGVVPRGGACGVCSATRADPRPRPMMAPVAPRRKSGDGTKGGKGR